MLKIRSQLHPAIKEDLVSFLKANLDLFVWTHSDMRVIDPAIACHCLSIDPTILPIKQKRRYLGLESFKALKEEVDRLINKNFIREAD